MQYRGDLGYIFRRGGTQGRGERWDGWDAFSSHPWGPTWISRVWLIRLVWEKIPHKIYLDKIRKWLMRFGIRQDADQTVAPRYLLHLDAPPRTGTKRHFLTNSAWERTRNGRTARQHPVFMSGAPTVKTVHVSPLPQSYAGVRAPPFWCLKNQRQDERMRLTWSPVRQWHSCLTSARCSMGPSKTDSSCTTETDRQAVRDGSAFF